MIARTRFCAAICFLAGSCAVTATSGQEPNSADAWAQVHGLVRLSERLWLLPSEVELREKLAELPRRRERIVTAEKEIESAIGGNLRTWQESRPVIAALQQSLAQLATSDPQRPVIERQIAGLETSAVDPVKLGGRTDMRKRLVELSAERCELLADVAFVRAAVPALKQQYQQIAAQPEVAAALQRDSKMRLGPQRSYRADMERLAEFEPLAATKWVPIFQQSGQIRVTALVNDRTPVTFTWSDNSDARMVLTASTAETLGLKVPADAPREKIPAGDKRTVVARQASLDYLRLGQCVMHGIPVNVLSPEDEDAGNRLGRMALADHRVRIDPARLRMWIDE